MNTTNQIPLLQIFGVQPLPQAPAKRLDSQGLSGFLNAIIQQLQGQAVSSAVAASPGSLQGLTEKIAALLQTGGTSGPLSLQNLTTDQLSAIVAVLLQKNGALPPDLQNLAPADLAQKIAVILEKSNVPAPIQPSLTRDLTAPLSPEIQAPAEARAAPAAPKPDLEKLAALLEKMEIPEETRSRIAGLLAQIKAPEASTPDASVPSLLQQLKEKITELDLPPGAVNKDVLVDFKADAAKFLKSEGLTTPEIERVLTALAKFLRSETPDADVAPELDVLPTAAAVPTEKPAVPAPPVIIVSEHASARAHEVQNIIQDIRSSLGQKEAAPPSLTPAEGKPETPVAALAQNAPSPESKPNVTAKVSGFGLTPSMISALAQDQGGLDSGGSGFQQGFSAQQDLTVSTGLNLGAAEAPGRANFVNYLNAAREASSPVTQMVYVQLQKNINSRVNTMMLQLEPADLGRMDIELKFEKDGGVRARMTVERPETLALLQKDALYLERALHQAGFDADDSSLSFDLRQQGQQHNLEGYDGSRNGGRDEFAAYVDGNAVKGGLTAALAVQSYGYITQSGVNIMV